VNNSAEGGLTADRPYRLAANAEMRVSSVRDSATSS